MNADRKPTIITLRRAVAVLRTPPSELQELHRYGERPTLHEAPIYWSMPQLAAHAGVSTTTLYDDIGATHFGIALGRSKRAMLMELGHCLGAPHATMAALALWDPAALRAVDPHLAASQIPMGNISAALLFGRSRSLLALALADVADALEEQA